MFVEVISDTQYNVYYNEYLIERRARIRAQ